RVDNVGLCILDKVWCMFKQGDISRLGCAMDSLKDARKRMERSHGANLERMRAIAASFAPEVALYVRLDLLEGVAAYHSGDLKSAAASLESARHKWERLQLKDDDVVQLMGMGCEPLFGLLAGGGNPLERNSPSRTLRGGERAAPPGRVGCAARGQCDARALSMLHSALCHHSEPMGHAR
ncbi:hypothetical protein CYMTET_33719, partial [Cymbomonas tetramitiformis]